MWPLFQFAYQGNCCKQLRYIRIVRFSSSTQLTLSIAYHVLYNVDDLCLRPYCIKYLQFVVAAGFEPATSNLSGSLSNQLIYATICRVSETRTRKNVHIPNVAGCQLPYYPIFVDPKGIEPSTLSLQGRNASHWNMRAHK